MELCLLFLIIPLVTQVSTVDFEQCISPLGMESGLIKDADISASSSFDAGNVGPLSGRIRTERLGGAWCPKQQVTQFTKEYYEINLRDVHVITAVETQGRFGNGQGVEYAEAYYLDYWRPKLGKWVRYKDSTGQELIEGNTNSYLEIKRTLNPPIWAQKIRFAPFSYHTRTVCMRVELYGCPYSDGIVSYTMPQGERNNQWEFFDSLYDGYWNDQLQNGLGLLTDGKEGHENFKSAFKENTGWVAWKNDSRNGTPVEMIFEFDRIREFTSVDIFTNNRFPKGIQVFARADVFFSMDGKRYTKKPVNYVYVEDCIFENPRNVTIRLYRHIGKFVKIRLFFANRWLMISEVAFQSGYADVNLTAMDMFNEELTEVAVITTETPVPEKPKNDRKSYLEWATLACVSLGVFALVLGIAYAVVSRYRQRQPVLVSTPIARKPSITNHLQQHPSTSSSCGTFSAKGGTGSSSSTHRLPHNTPNSLLVKVEDYQEPFQSRKYQTSYYGYTSVLASPKLRIVESSYDYAVPETGTLPLLGATPLHTPPPPCPVGPKHSISFRKEEPSYFKTYCTDESRPKNKLTRDKNSALELMRKLEQTEVPEFPRHRLRLLSKLGEGTFGVVYIAEADGILDYGTQSSLGRKLVAVKFLNDTATEREKKAFQRDVRVLAALEDDNIARVVATCNRQDPLCVIMEYLEYGDLNQFLKAHEIEDDAYPAEEDTIGHCDLLYIATQVASGMRYLESFNFVHRDLATRNVLIGKNFQIKISDFGIDNETFANEYHRLDGCAPLPIRWMPWESYFQFKYTTKSDVWAFGVTLWEILTLCREIPYENYSDDLVLQNLGHMEQDDGLFQHLQIPDECPKDIFDLMLECWRRAISERPSFTEIHLFLQRKNLGYIPN